MIEKLRRSYRNNQHIEDETIEIDVPDMPPTPEERLAALENATGTGDDSGRGTRGIAQRLDDIEDRVAAIEKHLE